MTEHYYSEKPESESRPHQFAFFVNGKTLRLTSDRGVFSKEGVDFGSRLLIETFKPPKVEGAILDMGCGYGAIGLAIHTRFPEWDLTMVDVNERAVNLARLNAKNNGIDAMVRQSNLYENVEGRFACIVTNPPIRAGKRVIYSLFEGAKTRLLPGGELWIVIQKKQGALSAIKKLQALFEEVEIVAKKKGYYIIRSA